MRVEVLGQVRQAQKAAVAGMKTPTPTELSVNRVLTGSHVPHCVPY